MNVYSNNKRLFYNAIIHKTQPIELFNAILLSHGQYVFWVDNYLCQLKLTIDSQISSLEFEHYLSFSIQKISENMWRFNKNRFTSQEELFFSTTPIEYVTKYIHKLKKFYQIQ